MAPTPISLAKWSQREVQSLFGSIARYTRFVFFGKFFLVVIAVSLVAVVFAIPFINKDRGGTRLVFENIEHGEAAPPKMMNPRFQGTDQKGQPYNVTADYALQQSKDSVALEKLNADIYMNDKSWLSLSADKGVINLATRKLQLNGNVHAFYDKGYEFFTDAMDIDISKKQATTNTGVVGQGTLGSIKAKGLQVNDNGQHFLFPGPVHVIIYNHKE